MANSNDITPWGPQWPLGSIVVPTPGTVVRIMHNVDPNNTQAPETQSNLTTWEYTPVVSQLQFIGMKQGAGNTGLVNNANNMYLMKWNSNLAGGGNKSDPGEILAVIVPGATVVWPPTGVLGGYISPYQFGLDADTANDACQATAFRS